MTRTKYQIFIGLLFLSVGLLSVNAQVNDSISEKSDAKLLFGPIEQYPQFSGGISALYKFLDENITYPSGCTNVKGQVKVQFFVEVDGSLSDVIVVKGFEPYYDAEAVRVVKSMPNWIPGKLQGKIVRMKFILPIFFRLE